MGKKTWTQSNNAEVILDKNGMNDTLRSSSMNSKTKHMFNNEMQTLSVMEKY